MKWLTVTNFQAPIALISLLAVGTSVKSNASISAANNPSHHNGQKDCNSTRQARMWGDVDPNIFYICDDVTNTARQMRCPAGRGFFNGRGFYGCIPYVEWPTCIDSRSSNSSSSGNQSSNATVELCTDEMQLQQTWAAEDPNTFYICPIKHSTPLLLNCEVGKGYVSAWIGEDGGGLGGHGGESTHIVGCATWEKWRMYMHCMDFY